jgi:P-aminobenzoate N-oxygenase AurF
MLRQAGNGTNYFQEIKMPETEHLVQSEFETLYQRDYSVQAPDMRRLYENAKRDQWNVSKDIDWTQPVDLDKGIFADGMIDGFGSPLYEKLDDKTKRELNIEFSCWRISQLLHGEEGAMLACSQLVDMVPTNDAKFFQCTQVVDEARHAEVLSRYLMEKCDNRIYPMSKNIKHLFDYLLGQGKWFIKTAGLQLVAETFAVGLFRMLAETSQDPLLKTISKRILLDESRHMGFSVIGLPEMIASLSPSDFAELEDFTAEACRLVLRGQFPRPAFEKVGFSEKEIDEIQRYRVENAKSNDYIYFRQVFRREMYTQVVSNMKKVGLMSDRTKANLMKLGIDPNIDGRNATLEQQPGA